MQLSAKNKKPLHLKFKSYSEWIDRSQNSQTTRMNALHNVNWHDYFCPSVSIYFNGENGTEITTKVENEFWVLIWFEKLINYMIHLKPTDILHTP